MRDQQVLQHFGSETQLSTFIHDKYEEFISLLKANTMARKQFFFRKSD